MTTEISKEAIECAIQEAFTVNHPTRTELFPGQLIQNLLDSRTEEVNLNWVNKVTGLGIRFDVGLCAWVNDDKTSLAASTRALADLRKVAEGLAGALKFIQVYQQENCNGQIAWRSPNSREHIAGKVRVKHVLETETAMEAYAAFLASHPTA